MPEPLPESEPEPKEAEEEEVGGEAEGEAESLEDLEEEYEEKPEEEEEWPDPTSEMEIGYLRQMAKAYAVEFTVHTSKVRLIGAIMKAMYPPDGVKE